MWANCRLREAPGGVIERCGSPGFPITLITSSLLIVNGLGGIMISGSDSGLGEGRGS